MKLIDLTCSRCGAVLKVNSELQKCICQYCGNEMLIDNEIVRHQLDNGYQFGYQAELGRQQALNDLKLQQQQQMVYQQTKKAEKPRPKEYNPNSVALIISGISLLICMFSTGSMAIFSVYGILGAITAIVFCIIAKKNIKYSNKGKGNRIIAIIGSIITMLGACSNLDNNSTNNRNYDNNDVVNEVETTVNTETASSIDEIISEPDESEENSLHFRLGRCTTALMAQNLSGEITQEDYDELKGLIEDTEYELLMNSGLENDQEYIDKVSEIENRLGIYEYEYSIEFNTNDSKGYSIINNISDTEPIIKMYTPKDMYGDKSYWYVIPSGKYEVTIVNEKLPEHYDAIFFIVQNEFYKWKYGSSNSAPQLTDSSTVYTIENLPDDTEQYFYDNKELDSYESYFLGSSTMTYLDFQKDNIDAYDSIIVEVKENQVIMVYSCDNGSTYTIWNKISE